MNAQQFDKSDPTLESINKNLRLIAKALAKDMALSENSS
jgi:hypothetical protein